MLNAIIEYFTGKDLMPIWEQFANEKHGKLKSTSGDLFVEYLHSNFKIQIGEFTHYVTSGGQTYESKYLIGILDFTNPDNFELSISPEDLLAKLGKLLKNEDIKIGNKNFDSKFLVKSNHEFKAVTVLRDKSLMEKIILANPTLLEITRNKGLFDEHRPPEGKFMLYFAKQEKFKEINQLNSIHLLLLTFIEKLKENFQIQN